MFLRQSTWNSRRLTEATVQACSDKNMKSSFKNTAKAAPAPTQLSPGLWRELHRTTPPPIAHPIPKLTLPTRNLEDLPAQRIDRFVRQRVARLLANSFLHAAAIVLCAGCTVVSYTGPGGERFSRQSFGTASAIGALQVETGTNGVRRIELKGYRSDSADAVGAVTEAAVRAALGTAAPVPPAAP